METSTINANQFQDSQGTPNEHTHNLFEFDEITVDSCFDSGNLMMASKFDSGVYELWIAPDAYKTPYEAKTGTFFHFRVSKIDLQGAENRRFEFKIKNIKKVNYNNYFRQDMLPVFKSPSNNGSWQFLATPLLERTLVNETEIEIKFEYTFNTLESQKEVFFCFTFPYSYSDCQNFIKSLEDKYTNHPAVYFHRETVIYSLEGRPMELLTITALDKSIFDEQGTAEIEPLLPDLFPNHPKEQTELPTMANRHLHRPFIWKNKRYVFLTARVHPGEPPANHMLQGLLLNLLDPNDPGNQLLLENFVFVIIPMLNPDGVYNGYTRTDSKGINWQFIYHLAVDNVKEHPGAYAVLEVAKSLNRDNKAAIYIDLHSHSNKDGGFLLGTWHPDFKSRVEMKVFARLLDIYSDAFDYQSSEFGSQEAWEDQTKMGIAKTQVRKQTGILHAYTLETSFHITKKDPLRYSIEHNPERLLNRSEMRRVGVAEFYRIGEAINNAILEMFVGHPNSKLPNTFVGDMNGLREKVTDIMNSSPPKPVKAEGKKEEAKQVEESQVEKEKVEEKEAPNKDLL